MKSKSYSVKSTAGRYPEQAPLSFALTGPAVDAFGAQATLVGAGILGAVVTAAALLVPGTRAVEAPPPRSAGQHAVPGLAQDVELV
jgi:hypothetical protein